MFHNFENAVELEEEEELVAVLNSEDRIATTLAVRSLVIVYIYICTRSRGNIYLYGHTNMHTITRQKTNKHGARERSRGTEEERGEEERGTEEEGEVEEERGTEEERGEEERGTEEEREDERSGGREE